MTLAPDPSSSSRLPEWRWGWRWGRRWGGAALLFLSALLVYLPAYSAGFIWDDPDYIVNNPNLRDLQGLVRTWTDLYSLPQWYPLVHTTYWLEYQLWGLWAPGYHTVNIVLHALGAVLLWRLLLRLDLPPAAALLGALLWSLHPVQVESVAWVTERKNTLSFIFYILAAICLLRWRDLTAEPQDRAADTQQGASETQGGASMPGPLADATPDRWGWYVLAVGAFVLALLSKTVTASLPAAYLVVVHWKRGRLLWRDLYPMLPLFLLGGVGGAITSHLEQHHVGASGLDFGQGLAERTLIAGRAVAFYLHTLVWPVDLAFIYPRWHIDPGVWWQWLFPLAAAGGLVALYALRRRLAWGRGGFAAYAFFVGTLFPALGFFNVYPHRYSFVADHFQHLASIAPLAVGGVLLARLPKAVPVLILSLLGVLTLLQSRIYHDPLTLWTDTAAKNPSGWMVHVNLGLAHADLARTSPDPAARRFHERAAYESMLQAARVAPDHPEALWNAGVAHDRADETDAARALFDRALTADPTFAPAINSLGQLHLRDDDLGSAERHFRWALRLQPNFPRAHWNLGTTLSRLARDDDAAAHLAAATNFEPTNPAFRLSLARHLKSWADRTPDPARKRQLLTFAAAHYQQLPQQTPQSADELRQLLSELQPNR